jgi:hypothetical protein
MSMTHAVVHAPTDRPDDGSVDEDPDQSYPIAAALAQLRAFGTGDDHSVTIVGRAGLSAQLRLCREGYQSVSHVRDARAAAREASDVMILADLCSVERIIEVLAEARRGVRDGGLVVTWSSRRRDESGQDPVHQALTEAGFTLERCVHRGAGELHLARRS